VTRFVAEPRARGLNASSIHQAYRTVKTFCRWHLATGAVIRNPLAGIGMRTSTTLPEVSTDRAVEDVPEALCRT